MEFLQNPETWAALLTLVILEIVLGIDNIIFVSIVANKLPKKQQKKARTIGLSLALILRIGLLAGITWVMGVTKTLFSLGAFDVSLRDIILILGGLFLIGKSTTEITQKMEGFEGHTGSKQARSLLVVIFQIIILDIIFSFDSILTAVGLTRDLPIMIIAVSIAVIMMISFSGTIGSFIEKFPSLEVLALSFLILIGFMLAVESFHYHVPKGYIYFALFFSLLVEIINLRIHKRKQRKEKRLQLDTKKIAEQTVLMPH